MSKPTPNVSPAVLAWRRIPVAAKTDADYLAYLLTKRSVLDSGCWKWLGPLSKPPLLPYGHFCYRSESWPAHKASYFLHIGPVPPGMEVMHECDNAWCVNPDHLRLGTHAENVKDCALKGRIFWGKKTHCPRGHAFDAENTIYVKGRVNPKRQCKACRKAAFDRRYARDRHLILARQRERRRSRRLADQVGEKP